MVYILKVHVALIELFAINESYAKQANSENCGPPLGNKSETLKLVKGHGQGHDMVPSERSCHKEHTCQVSMLHL